MAPEDKAPYKLVVKLDSARPDAISQAIEQLRDIAAEYDQTGKSDATFTIEAWKLTDLQAVMDDFEIWLFQHMIGIGCQMKIQRPGVRPEMVSTLRARNATPMDEAGWTPANDEAEEPNRRPDHYA